MTWEKKLEKIRLVYEDPSIMEEIQNSTKQTLAVSRILARKVGETLQEYRREHGKAIPGVVLADAAFALVMAVAREYMHMSKEDQRDVIAFMHVTWLETVDTDADNPGAAAPPFALYDAVKSMSDPAVN